MAGVQEENRRRFALILVGLGIFLILTGIGLGIHHQRTIRAQERPHIVEAPAPKLNRADEVRLIQRVLFMLLILVGILAISLYAFTLWSRHYRRMLARKPAPPTPSSDVWAMHKLPDDDLSESGPPEEFTPGGQEDEDDR